MLILAYVLGSIPSAVWIGKRYYGVDIREHGSKNAGTTNMLRVLGKRAAIPVFILDFFKGFAAVSLLRRMQNLGKQLPIISCAQTLLCSRYSDRITSRLIGEYTVIPFYGTDVRRQKLQRK